MSERTTHTIEVYSIHGAYWVSTTQTFSELKPALIQMDKTRAATQRSYRLRTAVTCIHYTPAGTIA